MKNFNYKILKVMAFSVIMLFMSSSVYAQVQENQQDTTAQDTTIQMNEQQQTMPQEQNQQTGDDMKSQHPDEGVDYSETIEQSELPQEVNSSLDELYPAHEVQEAYRGEDDSFKVKVKNETDEAVIYYDSEGKFLRAENLTGLNQQGTLPQEQGQRTMESQQDTAGYQQDMPQDDQQETPQGTQEDQWGTQDDDQESEMQNEDTAVPQEQNQRTDDNLRSQDFDKGVNYSETIQEGDLPQEVTSSLDELYPAHEIQEISKGDDDSYKVKVKNEDDVAVVYYDSQGDFQRAQNLSGLDQQGALPQEQGQRTEDDDSTHEGMHQGTMQQQDTQQNEWESDTPESGTDMPQGTEPQEQNQRIEDVEESQDADRWGTENRMPEQERSQDDNQGNWESDTTDMKNEGDTLSQEGSAFPQEQNQQMEGNQDEEKFEDNWGSEDMGAHQSTWKDGEGYPQEQNQQTTDDDGMEEQGDHSTWMGGEGTDTTSTPARIDTTAVYKNQWEEGAFEEGEDTATPQEQNQQSTDWEDADTTETTTPVDTSAVYQNQMREDNTLDSDDTAFPQEQNQQSKWGDADTTNTSDEYGTPADTTDMYNDQMMEDNTLDGDDSASPQEQYQTTGDEDVEYTEEIQENELPETVTSSLDELYPEHEIEEVYRGDDGSFKVKVKNNEDKVAVYYDSEGLFSRDEQLNSMLEEDNKDTNQDW